MLVGLLGSFIVFMSDFGLRDPYVGQVKAVLYRIASSPKIVDLTHMIEPFCVICGSYVLYSSYNWFPEKSVFLSVIDPGVGSSRRPLAVFSRKRFFVGTIGRDVRNHRHACFYENGPTIIQIFNR